MRRRRAQGRGRTHPTSADTTATATVAPPEPGQRPRHGQRPRLGTLRQGQFLKVIRLPEGVHPRRVEIQRRLIEGIIPRTADVDAIAARLFGQIVDDAAAGVKPRCRRLRRGEEPGAIAYQAQVILLPLPLGLL